MASSNPIRMPIAGNSGRLTNSRMSEFDTGDTRVKSES
jgi:hypothetical protein